jgi:hypothetical protein
MMPLLPVPSNQKITRSPRRNCRKVEALTSLSRTEMGVISHNALCHDCLVKKRVVRIGRSNRVGGMRLAGRRG